MRLVTIFVPGLTHGPAYKFLIHTLGGSKVEKMDPYAKEAELRPKTAAIVADPAPYAWGDQAWTAERPHIQKESRPVSIYEVHLGSWQKAQGRESGFLTYDELAERLIPYVKGMGYTHLELMPVYIDNLNRVLPRGEFLPVPLLSCITIGPPIWLEPKEPKADFLKRARDDVRRLKDV